MIRLHCTKKLITKLPLHPDGRLKSTRPNRFAANDGPETALSGWHANLLSIQRRQCVLFVHDETRFSVFLPALRKEDFADLDERFQDGFMNTLLKSGAHDDLMDRAHAALGPLVCDTECSRSVQGSMNQMAQDISYLFAYDGTPVAEITGYRVGANMVDRPCMVKGRKDAVWPMQAMRELLA